MHVSQVGHYSTKISSLYWYSVTVRTIAQVICADLSSADGSHFWEPCAESLVARVLQRRSAKKMCVCVCVCIEIHYKELGDKSILWRQTSSNL
jgi:hypothetical protein